MPAHIDELKDQESLQVVSQLWVGLKVTVEGREDPMLGIVTKINHKRIIVVLENDSKQ